MRRKDVIERCLGRKSSTPGGSLLSKNGLLSDDIVLESKLRKYVLLLLKSMKLHSGYRS